MNVKKVRWRLMRELDSLLSSDHVLSVKKEPVLPMKDQDRTEWLLWCCYTTGCSMEAANQQYHKALEGMKEMAVRIAERRKPSLALRYLDEMIARGKKKTSRKKKVKPK